MNPDEKKVMTLKFKKDLKIRIKSQPKKRQELKHIDEQLAYFDRIPDWGYGEPDQRYETPLKGWENFLELCQNRQKYEMAENHIC